MGQLPLLLGLAIAAYFFFGRAPSPAVPPAGGGGTAPPRGGHVPGGGTPAPGGGAPGGANELPPLVSTLTLEERAALEIDGMYQADPAKILDIAQALAAANVGNAGLLAWAAEAPQLGGGVDLYSSNLVSGDPIQTLRAAGWYAGHGMPQAAANLLAAATIASGIGGVEGAYQAVRDATEKGAEALYGTAAQIEGLVAALEETRAMQSTAPIAVQEIEAYLATLTIVPYTHGLDRYVEELASLPDDDRDAIHSALANADAPALVHLADVLETATPDFPQTIAQLRLLGSFSPSMPFAEMVPTIRALAEQGQA